MADAKSIAKKLIEKLAPDAETAVKLVGKERKQYLDALDTVHGPQSERAKKLGFGDETYYHGTKGNIEKFEAGKLGSSTGANSAKKAHFFAEDPKLAADYAELAPTLEKQNVIDNPKYKQASAALRESQLSGDKAAQIAAEKNMSQTISDLNSIQENVIPVKLNTSDSLKHDFKGAEYRDRSYSDLLKDANGRGVVLENARDPVYSTNDVAQTIVGVQDPAKIRSTNAAFDPRFKDSGLILAANGTKPNMGLGQAAGQLKSAYNRVMQPVDDIRNRIIQKLAAVTDISAGKETVSKDTREGILNLAAPDVSDAIPMGKVGKFIGAGAPIVANILKKEGRVLGKEIGLADNTAKALKEAPESKHGKLIIKDTEPKMRSGTLQIKDNILKRLLPAKPGSTPGT